jgi:hypothetical protein
MSPPVSAMITCATVGVSGNGLQQLDPVLPGPACFDEHRVQLGQGLLDQIQRLDLGQGQGEPGQFQLPYRGQYSVAADKRRAGRVRFSLKASNGEPVAGGREL